MIIAIDGPAGSGKSTTSKAVAQRLGFLFIDSGAMYRAVTLAFLRANREPTAEAAQEILPRIRVDLRPANSGLNVFLNGENVSDEIRTSEVSAQVSAVAALPAVRRKLVREQRRLASLRGKEGGGVVMDGRDIGTVVFPDADVKIFLIADEEARARRRQEELARRGEDMPLEQVRREIQRRDELDSTREVAPLLKAGDAIEIDTTTLSIEDQVERVLEVIEERTNLSAV